MRSSGPFSGGVVHRIRPSEPDLYYLKRITRPGAAAVFLAEYRCYPADKSADSAHTPGSMAWDQHRADARRRRGKAAEDLAASYLEARGLEVLARNVRCKGGEIDLVCRDGELLVVVEVRQRTRHDFGGALASVTCRKQRKIIRAARFVMLFTSAWRRCPVRFDVVGLQGEPAGTPQIVWIKDAFRAT